VALSPIGHSAAPLVLVESPNVRRSLPAAAFLTSLHLALPRPIVDTEGFPWLLLTPSPQFPKEPRWGVWNPPRPGLGQGTRFGDHDGDGVGRRCRTFPVPPCPVATLIGAWTSTPTRSSPRLEDPCTYSHSR